MHVDMWHTVIPCIVVLGLSPKDMHPYPNTLPIQSILGIDFWVFHPRDLIPFLIRLSRAFAFHYYFIFLSFFHFMHLSHFLFFLHTTMMHMKCHRINYPQSQVSQISDNIPTNSNTNKITIYTMISLFLNNPNNSHNQTKIFLHN